MGMADQGGPTSSSLRRQAAASSSPASRRKSGTQVTFQAQPRRLSNSANSSSSPSTSSPSSPSARGRGSSFLHGPLYIGTLTGWVLGSATLYLDRLAFVCEDEAFHCTIPTRDVERVRVLGSIIAEFESGVFEVTMGGKKFNSSVSNPDLHVRAPRLWFKAADMDRAATWSVAIDDTAIAAADQRHGRDHRWLRVPEAPATVAFEPQAGAEELPVFRGLERDLVRQWAAKARQLVAQ